jgi:hypothetical protein
MDCDVTQGLEYIGEPIIFAHFGRPVVASKA